MADSKISALTAITTLTPATDVLPVVDVTGTTKKITTNQILGSGGTATLASATITGNLTLSAGTVNGVGYLNASKVLTAGSALVFDGTNLGVGGTGQLRFATSGGVIGDNTIGTENSFSMMLRCGRGSTSNIELASDKLVFGVAATELMRLNATGLGVGVVPSAGKGALQLSSGINFPATQVASSDANTLDDYEEGTFTPTVVGTTGAGTGTYTTQLGRYTKVGRIVTCDISLVWTAHTGTGNIDIGGLPFSVLNTTDYAASAVIGYIDNIALTAGNIPMAVLWWFNTTKIRLNQTPTGGGAASGVPMDTAGQINLSITYIVA